MVDSVNNINNYITIRSLRANNKKTLNRTSVPSYNVHFTANSNITPVRTELSSNEEKAKYKVLLEKVDKTTKKQLDLLLKTGILLNSESNDKSTTLDNLYKMAVLPRAKGLDQQKFVQDTIATISYPYLITQQFGDIPDKYREMALQANQKDVSGGSIDVEHSGTCVAASIEFNLAKKMPAEFARFAEGLSSPDVSVKKEIKLNNLADSTLDAVYLLNAFEIPFEAKDFNKATLKFAPDNNAIIRATIQTTDRDSYERSPLDVLMQSTFMQVGSQQSYNSLTDKREGKFNQNDKGLIEYEKTFTESVVEDKNKLSVTYQTVDENAKLTGYEMSPDKIKKQILTALDMGENVIIGYTLTDKNNIIINGHEITITDYYYDKNGKLIFRCNDTDDNISEAIEYGEDYLLPKIHHAALPKCVLENEMSSQPVWVDELSMYKQLKQDHRAA